MHNQKYKQEFNRLRLLLPAAIDDKNIHPELHEELMFSEEIFLKHYYVNRKKEDEIAEVIFETGRLVCLVGKGGCGKTSTLYRILNKEYKNLNHKFLIIDFKRKMGDWALDDNSVSEFIIELKNSILEELKGKFLGTDRVKIRKLCAYILSDEYLYQYGNIQTKYLDLINKVDCLYEKRGKTTKKPCKREWIENAMVDDIEKIIDCEIIPKLRIQDIIWGLHRMGEFNTLVIVLDNIDRLPIDYQPYYLRFINDLEKIIGNMAITVIAIREENIKRPEPARDRGADIIETIELKDDDENQIVRKQRKAYTMYDITPEKIKDIIMKRYDYIKNIYIQTYGPSKKWEVIDHLTNVMNEAYREEELIRIANINCREVLDVHMDFLGYLLDLEQSNNIDLLQITQEDMKTYFYTWLVREGKRNNLFVYDIVARLNEWKKGTNSVGCMIEYLILSRLMNIKREVERDTLKNVYNYTLIRDILTDFQEIGYNKEDIFDALYNIYQSTNTSGHLLEIRHFKPLKNANSLDMDDQCWPSPRGEILCEQLGNKFSYVTACYYHNQKPPRYLFNYNRNEHVESNIKFLCDLAEMHLTGLEQIRVKLYPFHLDGWLKYYREKFCIWFPPDEPRYQLQQIIYNHVRHVKRNLGMPDDVIKMYTSLEKLYLKAIDELKSNNSIQNKRFNDELGIDNYDFQKHRWKNEENYRI